MWLDLAKFRHFGKKIKVFGNFFDRLFSIGQIISLFWQKASVLG